MKLPSKELLSEVLGRDVYKVKDIENNTLIYGCLVHDGWYDEINIYELAHKCKEWALSVYNNIDFMVYGRSQCDLIIFTQPDDIKYNFNADTEIEAIFKACEWILEQTKCGS
jgi:hypothetical protein